MGNQADRAAPGAASWPFGRLILVKHGKPQIVEAEPRSSWPLSEEGRVAARALAAKLADLTPSRLFASPEIKAADTAREMGRLLDLAVEIVPDLGEHRADDKPFGTQAAFEADVARLFAEPAALVMGEETGDAAYARFDAAMARIAPRVGETALAVSHGRIITLWLSRRLGVEPMAFWKRLGLATAVVVTAQGHGIVDP